MARQAIHVALCLCLGGCGDSAGPDEGTAGQPSAGPDAGTLAPMGGDECCPARPPQLATSCPCPDRDCVYLDCDDTGQTVAGCNRATGLWDIATAPCRTPQCEPLCAEDGLCVVEIGDEQMDVCADNPCGEDPITCECAHGVCAGRCLEVLGRRVMCDVCPSGPCPPDL